MVADGRFKRYYTRSTHSRSIDSFLSELFSMRLIKNSRTIRNLTLIFSIVERVLLDTWKVQDSNRNLQMTTIKSYDYNIPFSLSYQEYELIMNFSRSYVSISDHPSLDQTSSVDRNCCTFFSIILYYKI